MRSRSILRNDCLNKTSGATGRLGLQLGNIQLQPLEVLWVTHGGVVLYETDDPVIVDGKIAEEPIQFQTVPVATPAGVRWSDDQVSALRVHYRLMGTMQVRQESVFPWPYEAPSLAERDLRRPNAERFDFLIVSDDTKRILIRPGHWKVDRVVVIPEGYRFVCGPGKRIDLSNGATILSYSALEWAGDEEQPIVIESTDGEGVAVIRAGAGSVVDHAGFANLSNPTEGAWSLTGAVTFYESGVETTNCELVGNRCQDTLNIIRSIYRLDRCIFRNTLADAFDADFATGAIIDTAFLACGNDGIDASGGSVRLGRVTIDGAEDKGLSAGENAQMTATKVTIRDAAIAVASKDLSRIILWGAKISGSEIGLTAYQKKPKFGAASIVATGRVFGGSNTDEYLAEEGSTVTVDGRAIAASQRNVKQIMYGVEFGKSSKPSPVQ